MKQEILQKNKVLLFVIFAVLCTYIVTACGSDDEEEIRYEHGIYTYAKPKVFTGEIMNMHKYVTNDGQTTYSMSIIMDYNDNFKYPYVLECSSVDPKNSKPNDRIKFKLYSFSDPDPHFCEYRTAKVEILEVIK